ncbi:MAG TPA: hypothetical protein VGE04_16140, partial [Chloroflexia bacterium]
GGGGVKASSGGRVTGQLVAPGRGTSVGFAATIFAGPTAAVCVEAAMGDCGTADNVATGASRALPPQATTLEATIRTSPARQM